MPITAARRTYSAIAVRPIPTDREITRSLTPQAYFRRRTSRIFRIGNLSAGIGPPIASTAKGGTLPRSDCRQRPPSHPINRVTAFVRIAWPLSIGIGGRLPSESVAALPRIPHQQLHLIVAIRELASGASVQQVSADLGYESVTAFITMFKKALGMPPAKHLSSVAQEGWSHSPVDRLPHPSNGRRQAPVRG